VLAQTISTNQALKHCEEHLVKKYHNKNKQLKNYLAAWQGNKILLHIFSKYQYISFLQFLILTNLFNIEGFLVERNSLTRFLQCKSGICKLSYDTE
jgi:hypothetical protein